MRDVVQAEQSQDPTQSKRLVETTGTPLRVLAAVDGSDWSTKVLMRAAAYAGANGSGLTVLHIVEPLAALDHDGSLEGLFESAEDATRWAEARVRKGFQTVVDLCRSLDLPDAEPVVQKGSAAATICREAEELDADLVVLGAWGDGPTPRLLLGSVSSRVVTLCARSVAVVK